jgi:hypothetical protein
LSCPTLPVTTQVVVPLQRNGQTINLQQRKFHVSVPFLYSSAGYGFLFNMPGYGSVAVGALGAGGAVWNAAAALGVDFWVTTVPAGAATSPAPPGPVYRQYADATGHAPLLREDALLYWQSRNRYKSSAIVEEIALPEALFPAFHLPVGVEMTDELYVHYQRHHGCTVMRVTEKLSAIAAPAGIAAMLGRAACDPVLHIARIAFDVMDRPVERRLSWMETSALRYAIELR